MIHNRIESTPDKSQPQHRRSKQHRSDLPGGHRLAYLDQTALELLHATGRNQLMQCVWVYEHQLDRNGIVRFHRNLFASFMASRLVERSPIPFGRPRWVRSNRPIPAIHEDGKVRPRDELLDWLNELGDLPIDPENGPVCYVAVQSFDDGATGVCLVGSHVVADGIGGMLAAYEAITGSIRDPGYELRGLRSRGRAIMSDLGQALRDLPRAAGTAFKAGKVVIGKKRNSVGFKVAQRSTVIEDSITLPSAVIFVDVAQWDSRAEALGGNSYSLIAGFAAKLAEQTARQRLSDGKVTLLIAINLREGLEDDRALAMAFANAVVDPVTVTSDLTEARSAVRDAREKAKQEPDETMELLPLVPWLPRGAVKTVAEMLFAYSEDLPVSCSNLGDLPSELANVDGTPAEYLFMRGLDANVTESELQRSHGQLVLVSGRLNGKIFISIEAYQLGAENSRVRLREMAARTLGEFGLSGEIV